MSALNTIHLALSSLLAQQKALEVTGHNVANVATPGYHRQEAVLRAREPAPAIGSPMSGTGGMYGTGVDVQQVRRLSDTFLQQQMRDVEGQQGRWSMAYKGLQQIESFLAPGSTLNLSTLMDRFFGAWQQLSTHPEEEATRSLVLGEGTNLTNGLNDLSKRLDTMTNQFNMEIRVKVDRLNGLSSQLAELNTLINVADAEGRAPNDLLDRRQLIFSEMATIAGISSLSANDNGGITNLGGRTLAQGSVAHQLRVVDGAGGQQVVWGDGTPVQFQSGELASLFALRDSTVPAYKGQIDAIALALSSSVNALHTSGSTMLGTPAGNFFEGTTAGSLRVNSAIVADPRHIAATRLAGAVGDGTLAMEIAKVAQQPLIGNQTLHEAAQSMLSQIGQAVRGAQTSGEVTSAMKAQLDTQQMSIAGVNLDEEMMNLLIFQRAYDASARVLRVADEMMRTLLERL